MQRRAARESTWRAGAVVLATWGALVGCALDRAPLADLEGPPPPSVDAGFSMDAGPRMDGGALRDAGPIAVDAGRPETDAGMMMPPVCGGVDQPCCAGAVCAAGACVSGTCRTGCGRVSQGCCPGDVCAAGGVCVDRVFGLVSGCEACGGSNELCCAGRTCEGSLTCTDLLLARSRCF